MLRRFALLASVSFFLFVVGCERHSSISGYFDVKPPVNLFTMVEAAGPVRFVAVRHKLEVISPDTDLPSSWQAVITYCGTIRCEVMSSSVTMKTTSSPPFANVFMRVAPEDVEKLIAFIKKQGSIFQHSTESVDKTTEVVDTDARVKNLTSFRDNLRTMLAKPSTSVKDSVDIQEQLTDVQSQLDSETAQRIILANETEKVAIEIAFRVESPVSGAHGFSQIVMALRESGSVLADSTASLITAVVAVVPWMILILPLCWIFARLWRRLRRKRDSSLATKE